MKNAPTTISSTSGVSFAIVATVLKRVTPRTPRAFAAASATSTTTSAMRLPISPIDGTTASRASAKNEETADIAKVIPTQSSAPLMNPTNGPNAVSTYAYGPPVMLTRLPASAKQTTMRPIATVQARYANGAAAPSDAATPEGRRKM